MDLAVNTVFSFILFVITVLTVIVRQDTWLDHKASQTEEESDTDIW